MVHLARVKHPLQFPLDAAAVGKEIQGPGEFIGSSLFVKCLGTFRVKGAVETPVVNLFGDGDGQCLMTPPEAGPSHKVHAPLTSHFNPSARG